MGRLGKGAPIPTEEQAKKWKEFGVPRYYLQHGLYSRDGINAQKYGISKEELQRLRNSSCEICGKEAPSEVDHSHVCQKCGHYTERLFKGSARCQKCREWLQVRGSLCMKCNRRLSGYEAFLREGQFQVVSEYLKRYI